jgi:hypothetical protein
MEHLDLIPGLLRGKGVEIGPFKTPLPGITPVYLDRFAEYAGERTLADCYGDPPRFRTRAFRQEIDSVEHR